MIEFFQGVASFFSTLWDWLNELSKFFDVVRDTFSECYVVLDKIGLSAIIGTLTVFLSILLITKILGK